MVAYFLLIIVLVFSTVGAQDNLKVTVVVSNASDIYLTDLSGEPTNLTNSEGKEIMPMWSPDGQRIAYLYDPYIPDGDNFNIHILTLESGETLEVEDLELTSEAAMQWSPDGKFIAVTLNTLFRVDTETGDVMPLMEDNYASFVSWSPDSSRLAFLARGELYSMSVDGQELEQLGSENIYQPRYMPTIDTLTYIASNETGIGFYLMDVDDKAVTSLASFTGYNIYGFAWSPDGEHLAFNVLPAYTSEAITSGGADVYVINRDGSGLRSVTLDARDSLVGWSPDGKQIIYWAGEPGGASGSFYAVNVEDGTQTLLSDAAMDERCSYYSCGYIDIRPTLYPAEAGD